MIQIDPKTSRLLDEMQAEQREWSLKNFGAHGQNQPVRGVIEELGELEEALHAWNREKAIDALADVMVFMADFASSSTPPVTLSNIYLECASFSRRNDLPVAIIQGKLAHLSLKLDQGIRKVSSDDLAHWMSRVCYHVFIVGEFLGIDTVTVIMDTWAEVKKRDWKKDPAHAGQNV